MPQAKCINLYSVQMLCNPWAARKRKRVPSETYLVVSRNEYPVCAANKVILNGLTHWPSRFCLHETRIINWKLWIWIGALSIILTKNDCEKHVDLFKKDVSNLPIYTCISCHRDLFPRSVVEVEDIFLTFLQDNNLIEYNLLED